jgi:hypothetical protein
MKTVFKWAAARCDYQKTRRMQWHNIIAVPAGFAKNMMTTLYRYSGGYGGGTQAGALAGTDI